MNLSSEAEKRLKRIADGALSASGRDHASGYGGLTRPIPIPPVYQELIGHDLVFLTEEPVARGYHAVTTQRFQWVYKATDLGRVTAKLLGDDA